MRSSWWFGCALLAVGLAGGCVVNNPGTGNENGNDNSSGNDNEDVEAVEVRVETGFDGVTRQKTTAGVEEAGICGGFYPAEPNHNLYVDASLGMTIRVSSDEGEPMLWVLCGESNFCGSAVDENVVELSRFWSRGGPCEIYIGTTEADQELAYTLTFFENE